MGGNATRCSRLRSKNRRTLRRFATGSARIKAARDLRNDVE